MPIKNRFAEMLPEITEWRHDFHAHPELLFDTHRTSGIVAEKLRAFGCDEVVEGLGRTGVVGVIKGKIDTDGRVVGLRADMDALPIFQGTGLAYASKAAGMMHACGHDVHMTVGTETALNLAAQKEAWQGTLMVIAQPAEERGAGAKAMLADEEWMTDDECLQDWFAGCDYDLELKGDTSIEITLRTRCYYDGPVPCITNLPAPPP